MALLLAVVLSLFMMACGGSNETPDTTEAPMETTTAAPETTEAEVTTAPAETEPKLVSVEITMDNWQDYFELREYTDFRENGFGEIDDAFTYWTLVSKDGYAVEIDHCDVTFEFTYYEEHVASRIDTEAKTVIYGEVTGNWTSEPKVETMNGVGQYIGENTNERYGEYLNAEVFDMEDGQLVSVLDRRIVNITVMRINGTFSYYE